MVIGFVLGALSVVASVNLVGFLEDPILSRVFGIGTFVVYYVAFEATLGRTPGKMVIGTRVIRDDGGKPRVAQVIGRSFARFIPFEPLSIFFGNMWHDSLSNTRVVQSR